MASFKPSGNRPEAVRIKVSRAVLETLGRQVESTVLRQAAAVQARAGALITQVLISEWPASYRQARQVASELRTLLTLLGFYRDVCGEKLTARNLDLLVDHQCHARMLLVQLACLETGKDNVALSDWFEYNVIPWCLSLETGVKKMQRRRSHPTDLRL